MAKFKFGDLVVDVAYAGHIGADKNVDVYKVRLSDLEGYNFIQRMVPSKAGHRTPAVEFDIARTLLSEIEQVAMNPDAWMRHAVEDEKISELEASNVAAMAERLSPFMNEAIEEAGDRSKLYEEYRSGTVGPLGFDMGRRRKR